ncbi:methyltransferase domain-containing protein [Acaryochloris thomasi]|nr:class I SAM-dependent methyltransferase [Acaryochloris thomasi]
MDPKQVAIGSRFIASIQVSVYQELIEKHASGVLLDLGCGDVPLYQMYKNLVTDNICIDWADSLHQKMYLDHAVNLNEGIPLSDSRFDTVLMTDVLEHISNPQLVMREIARVLKPKGKLILTVPFFYWLHETPYDYFRYTEFSLRMFCEENNLNILLLDAYGGALEVILDIMAKQLVGSSILSSLHFRLSKALIKSHMGRRRSDKTSHKFPLGYCLVAEKIASIA